MTSSDAIPSFEPLIELYASQGRWLEVRRYALDWLKSSPIDSTAHYWAAWASMRLGEMRTAEQHARSMSVQGLCGWLTPFLWAEIRLTNGEVNSALAAIRHALELAPEAACCHHTLSRVHLQRGEHQQALEAIEAALRLEPDNPTYRASHSIIWRTAGNAWTAASAVEEIRKLKQVMTLDPRNDWVLARIGQVYATELWSYDDAVDFLQQSLDVDPTNVETRKNLLEAQLRREPIYRWLASPLQQLAFFDANCPHWRVPWFMLPFVFYGIFLLLFGALLNLLWLWLPSQLYRHFVRADLCWGESTMRWQRGFYQRLMRVPQQLRLMGWIGATLAYWCVQFVLLAIYAPWIFLPAIPIGALSLLFTWRVGRNARLVRKQLI